VRVSLFFKEEATSTGIIKMGREILSEMEEFSPYFFGIKVPCAFI
jgi:hypothetical protein